MILQVLYPALSVILMSVGRKAYVCLKLVSYGKILERNDRCRNDGDVKQTDIYSSNQRMEFYLVAIVDSR